MIVKRYTSQDLSLKKTGISDEEFNYEIEVWDEFYLTNVKDYYNLRKHINIFKKINEIDLLRLF